MAADTEAGNDVFVTRRWFLRLLALASSSTAVVRRTLAQERSAPGSTVTSHIHNAPNWAAAAAYKRGERIVNLRTKPARAYECVTGGTSAAPAPSGTGARIKDGGGVEWKYLSEVDYISITGWLYDAPAWASGTSYRFHDYVTSGTPLQSYRCAAPGSGRSSVAPSGTEKKTYADGYIWEDMALVIYSSGKSHIPTEKYFAGAKASPTVQMAKTHTAQLWNDAEYVAGAGGENHPIAVEAHQDYTDDLTNAEYSGGPHGLNVQIHITLEAAPGESFMDHQDARNNPLGYDPAKGVAIRNPSGGTGANIGDGILIHDSYVTIKGIQIKSDTGRGIAGALQHDNGVTLRDCIIESGAAANVAAVELDSECEVDNCLIIGSGKVGVWCSYNARMISSTIVAKAPFANSIGIIQLSNHRIPSTSSGLSLVRNCAIFGWANAAGYGNFPAWDPASGHNASDKGNTSDKHEVKDPGHFGADAVTVDALPGSGNRANLPYNDTTFVNHASDWRPGSGSRLAGIGVSIPRNHHPSRIVQ